MRTFFGLGFIVAWVAVFVGWVMNIVQVVHLIGENSVTTMFIAKCVGIFFFPLGAILGFIG